MELSEEFDVRKLGVDPPCFIRGVDRSHIGGDKNDAPELRSERIRNDVLSVDGGALRFSTSRMRKMLFALLVL